MMLIWNENSHKALGLYLDGLVNQFFKILPMREEEEPSLLIYVESLQMELSGCSHFLERVGYDPQFISLLAILQSFLDCPHAPVSVYKREVFKGISICNKLKQKYNRGYGDNPKGGG